MNECIEMVMDDRIHAAVLNQNQPEKRQLRLLKKAARVVEAFHKEAPKMELFSYNRDAYMGCCILAAFTVRDVLRRLNEPANVLPCSLVLMREDPGASNVRCVVSGDPDAERSMDTFNGHLVVRCGTLLIDPVAGQVGRRWNFWHKPNICAVATRPLTWTDPSSGKRLAAIANGGNRIPNASAYQHWAYLRRPDLENDSIWRTAPDAAPERRAELVTSVLETYRRGGFHTFVSKLRYDLEPYVNVDGTMLFV